jgi:hypothetical protein
VVASTACALYHTFEIKPGCGFGLQVRLGISDVSCVLPR